jgi:sugar/nucleoside kinase (ribokinase family)
LRTAFAAVVGDDVFGRFMVDALTDRGVDTSGVVVSADEQTGLTVVLVRDGDRGMLTFPGAIASLRADAVDGDLLGSARHVHVASYFLQTALTPGLPDLFGGVRAEGGSTSIDPNWDPAERWNGGLKELLPLTDVFLPNAEEATRITGAADASAAAADLSADVQLTAVKLGRDGALAATSGGVQIHAAAPEDIEPVDTTGAGDSFDAGLLTGLLHGWSRERALALACACGALSTRAAGGTAAQPTLAEALELVERAA